MSRNPSRNPEAKFSILNIMLKNGENYGCYSVNVAVLPDFIPAISFLSSGYQKTVAVEDIKEISISIDTWCPRCE